MFVENILFIKIISNLILIFEKTYNFATFNISLSFLYICIILLEFDFTILNFDLKDFDCKNLANFDFAILNILINVRIRALIASI